MNVCALERFGKYSLYSSMPTAAKVVAVVARITQLMIGDLIDGIPDGFRIDTPNG